MRYASYHKKFLPSFGADKAFDWIVEAINPADLAAPGGQKTDYRLLKCIFKAVRADPSFEPTPGAAEVQDTIVYLCSSVDTAILPLSTFQDLVDRFVIAYYRDKPLEHLIDRIYLYDMDREPFYNLTVKGLETWLCSQPPDKVVRVTGEGTVAVVLDAWLDAHETTAAGCRRVAGCLALHRLSAGFLLEGLPYLTSLKQYLQPYDALAWHNDHSAGMFSREDRFQRRWLANVEYSCTIDKVMMQQAGVDSRTVRLTAVAFDGFKIGMMYDTRQHAVYPVFLVRRTGDVFAAPEREVQLAKQMLTLELSLHRPADPSAGVPAMCWWRNEQPASTFRVDLPHSSQMAGNAWATLLQWRETRGVMASKARVDFCVRRVQ
jgi:hypothetical protein